MLRYPVRRVIREKGGHLLVEAAVAVLVLGAIGLTVPDLLRGAIDGARQVNAASLHAHNSAMVLGYLASDVDRATLPPAIDYLNSGVANNVMLQWSEPDSRRQYTARYRVNAPGQLVREFEVYDPDAGTASTSSTAVLQGLDPGAPGGGVQFRLDGRGLTVTFQSLWDGQADARTVLLTFKGGF